jgi:hypothetical protein
MAIIQITGRQLQVDANGLAQETIPFFCDTSGEAFQFRPQPPNGMFLGGKQLEDLGCGKFKLTCAFYAIDPSVRKSVTEIDGDFAKNPIERAKKVKELVDKYSGEVDATTNLITFPQTYSQSGSSGLSGGGGSTTNPMYGVRYQDLARFQIRVRYITEQQPINLSQVGKKCKIPSVGGVTLPTDLSSHFIIQPPSLRTLAKEIGGTRAIWEVQESLMQYDNEDCPDELHATGSFQFPTF